MDDLLYQHQNTAFNCGRVLKVRHMAYLFKILLVTLCTTGGLISEKFSANH